MKTLSIFQVSKFLLGVFLILVYSSTNAQPIAAYTFDSSQRQYEPLANGTELGDVNNFDVIFSDINLGFTFNFGGNDYSQISASSKGYVKLGSAIETNWTGYPLTELLADNQIIAPLGGYITSNNDSGRMAYETMGIAPNRIFVLEWKNYRANFINHLFNVQLRLHETTNLIEFNYGNFTFDPEGFAVYLQVGLRGNTGFDVNDVNQRNIDEIVNDWSTSVIGSPTEGFAMLNVNFLPENGLLYTFTPSPNCTGLPLSGTVIASASILCPGQELNLTLSDLGAYATGIKYTWQYSTNAIDYVTLQSSPYANYSTIFQGSSYYKVIVSCGTDSSESIVAFVDAVAGNTFASVPLIENFEEDWEERCGVLVPNAANWSNNNSTSDMSWIQANPTDYFLPEFSGKAAFFKNAFSEGSSVEGEYTGDIDLHVNLSGNDNYSLSFYHVKRFFDFSNDSLVIFLSTDAGQTFSRKAVYESTVINPMDTLWNKKTINLGSANSATSVIRFRGYADGFFLGQAIDSVSIFISEGCIAPQLIINAISDTICAGSSIILTVTGNADNYMWSTGETTSSIAVSPLATTMYHVIGLIDTCTANAQFNVAVEICSGVDKTNDDKLNVHVFPNPTSGEIIIKFNEQGAKVLYLFDLSGREILKLNTVNEIEILYLYAVEKGSYVLRVERKGKLTENIKIIKQ